MRQRGASVGNRNATDKVVSARRLDLPVARLLYLQELTNERRNQHEEATNFVSYILPFLIHSIHLLPLKRWIRIFSVRDHIDALLKSTFLVAIWHNKKTAFAGNRFHCSISIAVFPNVMAWYTWTHSHGAPAPFGFVNSAKASFILEHQAYLFPGILGSRNLYGIVNFFEASIASSLAFLGCLLRGITFRQPCRCRTQYICPLLT